MTPSEALDQAIVEAQKRFKYIADPPTLDEWDTVKEFEARGGGDCDGWVLWCLARAEDLARAHGCWWFVVGTVTGGKATGHAWAEIRLPDGRLWADPTWGKPCERPEWYTDRTSTEAYPVDQEIMGPPVYEVRA